MTVVLSDLCELIVDSEHKTAPVVDSGHPMIRTPNIGEGRFLLDGVRRVDEQTYAVWTRRAVPQEGDLILAREAPVGNVAMIPPGMRPILGQRTVLIRPDRAKVEPAYLQYLMLGREVQHRMLSLANGATVPHLNMKDIRELEIPDLPELQDQRKVAAVLAAYDELIENNLRRIEILEEMAKTLYREWFVNFRFPGHEDVDLVDSPLGPIPEGWEVSTLGDESSVVMGQSPKSEFYNDDGIGLPFHQGVTYFGTLFPEHVKYCTVESRIAEAGDTLVSVRAPVGRINVADTRMVIGRGLAAVRNLNDECPGFHYRQLRSVFREEDSMGGGTIYKAITKGDLLGVPWLVPPSDTRAAFDVLERPLFALTANLTRQIRNLRATRDLLLPKLVSGEIDVSDLDIDTEWLAS